MTEENCAHNPAETSAEHISGAFPHVYDKTKPEIDVVAVGKAYIDPLS